jgi:hypothetical protein
MISFHTHAATTFSGSQKSPDGSIYKPKTMHNIRRATSPDGKQPMRSASMLSTSSGTSSGYKSPPLKQDPEDSDDNDFYVGLDERIHSAERRTTKVVGVQPARSSHDLLLNNQSKTTTAAKSKQRSYCFTVLGLFLDKVCPCQD